MNSKEYECVRGDELPPTCLDQVEVNAQRKNNNNNNNKEVDAV